MKMKLLFVYLTILYAFLVPAYAIAANNVVQKAIKAGVPSDQVYLVINKARSAHIQANSTDEMIEILIKAKESGVPVNKITNKILEGISKHVNPEIIINTCNKLEQAYKEADTIYNGIDIKGAKTGELKDAMAMAIFNGISSNELKALYQSAPGKGEFYYIVGTVSLTSLLASGMSKDQGISFIKRAFIEHKSANDIQNETMKLIEHTPNEHSLMRQGGNEGSGVDMNRMNMPNNPANRMPMNHGMDMHNQRN